MMNRKPRLDIPNGYPRISHSVVNISTRVSQDIFIHAPSTSRNPKEVTHVDLTIENYDGYVSSDTEAGSVAGQEDLSERENTGFNENDYLDDDQLESLLHLENDHSKVGAQIDHPTTIFIQEYNGLVPGMAVELTDGDFMRVKKILRLFNGDVFLRGYYFSKLMKLPTPFPQRHRELCWLMRQDTDGSILLEKDIAISSVRGISRISLTNQNWHSRVTRLPDSYICRLAWQDTVEKGETIIRYLSFDEADHEFRVPSHILRQQWRETTIPFGSEEVSNSTTARVSRRERSLKMQRQYSFGDAFCGAGGVSVGASEAGLRVKYGIDMDEAACQTYRTNFIHSWCYHADFTSWHALHGADELQVDISHSSPPCQPFSPAHTRSYNVQRDEANSSLIFSAFNMIQKVKPRIHTIEETFGVVSRHKETLERMLQDILELGYSIHSRVLSCEKYGVPQSRKRLFIMAAGPGEKLPIFPAPTHGPGLQPYVTIKDVIENIPRLAPNHDLEYTAFADGIPRAPYDENSLAKTITCGGGEKNYHPSGLRHFTIRELASLQTFPIQYKFPSSYAKKQIGNSVPPRLAEVIYRAAIKSLQETDEKELDSQAIVID
ncbi:hypothetical protein UA08_01339 [Talaromyces atroroseus]|uniref:DNA (cytosine-5-)-methyltransferase n=1 Tax=Talaromyces atroroseus TaxID=1441469 RepID=A0A1Q5QBC6_TALAT|nr:hypothetical protein UA08_01339 [Talaromyces atroroseus]OKL63243.1 hypothetical protein UA08_01339 [Talaromyces atroroseus]